MASKRLLAAALAALAVGSLTADAQQNLPRPIVLYRPPANAAQSSRGPATTSPAPATIVSPNGSRPNPTAVQQVSQTNLPNQNGQPAEPAANNEKTAAHETADLQSRPTNQMLQNPSGAFNMTHSGISSSQQMAPNTYFGGQFQNWSNQQPVRQMSSTFGETNRFQPGAFGGYVAPNTYVGSGFSSWNNLSQGGISTGATGSWSFSVWP